MGEGARFQLVMMHAGYLRGSRAVIAPPDGVRLAREVDRPSEVPRADMQIDFEVEDAEERVYLRGRWQPTRTAVGVRPARHWEALDETSE